MLIRAHCEDCDWTLERRLDQADLPEDENREIAARVTRTHAFRCGASGDQDSWGTLADVRLDMPEVRA